MSPTVHHFVTEMCTQLHISVAMWCIGGYGTGALWDLCGGSIVIYDIPRNSNLAKSRLLITYMAASQSMWNFAQGTVVSLPKHSKRLDIWYGYYAPTRFRENWVRYKFRSAYITTVLLLTFFRKMDPLKKTFQKILKSYTPETPVVHQTSSSRWQSKHVLKP